jgi:predicted DNA binding protein
MKKCIKLTNNKLCQKEDCPHDGYINKPEYDNCWHIYKYYINDKPHSLSDISKILNISPQNVKKILESAINKIKEKYPQFSEYLD